MEVSDIYLQLVEAKEGFLGKVRLKSGTYLTALISETVTSRG